MQLRRRLQRLRHGNESSDGSAAIYYLHPLLFYVPLCIRMRRDVKKANKVFAFVLFDLFVSPFFCVSLGNLSHLPYSFWR